MALELGEACSDERKGLALHGSLCHDLHDECLLVHLFTSMRCWGIGVDDVHCIYLLFCSFELFNNRLKRKASQP